MPFDESHLSATHTYQLSVFGQASKNKAKPEPPLISVQPLPRRSSGKPTSFQTALKPTSWLAAIDALLHLSAMLSHVTFLTGSLPHGASSSTTTALMGAECLISA